MNGSSRGSSRALKSVSGAARLLLHANYPADAVHADGNICVHDTASVLVPRIRLTSREWQAYHKPHAVTSLVASMWQVPVEQVSVGHGIDDCLRVLAATCPRNRPVLCFWPAYPFAEMAARGVGRAITRVELRPDGRYPAEIPFAVRRRKPGTAFIINPTNPGGVAFDDELLDMYQEQLPDTIFVVDEAFIAYCPDRSLLRRARHDDRLAVIHGLSKSYDLPGARIGMLLAGDCRIAEAARKVAMGNFYNPQSVAIAVEALLQPALLESTVTANVRARAKLLSVLRTCGKLVATTTDANFTLVRFCDTRFAKIFRRNLSAVALHGWWFDETPLFRRYFGMGVRRHPSLQGCFRLSPLPDWLSVEGISRLQVAVRLSEAGAQR